MAQQQDEVVRLLQEIRDLLVPMSAVVEPDYQLLIRRQRAELAKKLDEFVGKSIQRRDAAFLMTGSNTQKAIRDETGMDSGNLSRFVDQLAKALLLEGEDRVHPKLKVFPRRDGAMA